MSTQTSTMVTPAAKERHLTYFSDKTVDGKKHYGKHGGPRQRGQKGPQYQVAQVPERQHQAQHHKKGESILVYPHAYPGQIG